MGTALRAQFPEGRLAASLWGMCPPAHCLGVVQPPCPAVVGKAGAGPWGYVGPLGRDREQALELCYGNTELLTLTQRLSVSEMALSVHCVAVRVDPIYPGEGSTAQRGHGGTSPSFPLSGLHRDFPTFPWLDVSPRQVDDTLHGVLHGAQQGAGSFL